MIFSTPCNNRKPCTERTKEKPSHPSKNHWYFIFLFSVFNFSEIFQTAQQSRTPKRYQHRRNFLDFSPSSLIRFPASIQKHTIYHLTTNYHFSHVTVACFTLCNLSRSTPNKSQQEHNWRVKPAYTLQSHNGVLLLLSLF